MSRTVTRRYRRRTNSKDVSSFKKDGQNEQQFFGETTTEPFFRPVAAAQQSATVQRKSAGFEKEDKQVHRLPETKKEEQIHRASDKKEEDKIHKKEATNSSGNASTTAASYISSINGKGQNMDAGVQSFYESRMGADFSDVKIHTGKEAAESAKDINAQAYAYGDHIVFGEGKYQPGSDEGRRLLAHELVHTQQDKNVGDHSNKIFPKKAGQSKFISSYDNWVMGVNTYGKEVKVVRQIGSEDGYPEKLQAVSLCRMAGIDPAAVVEDYYGMWHAFEVSENCYGGFTSVRDFSPPNGKIYGLPSSAQMVPSKPGDKPGAALVLGIDENDILFNLSPASRKTGKVNFDTELATTVNAPLGTTSPETWGDKFIPGQSYAIELSTNLLDTPQQASAVLFHEASHLSDYMYTQYWVSIYQKETRKTFDKSSPDFFKWIYAQVPKRLSLADAELVYNMSSDVTAPSEARAHTHTMLAALQVGAVELAKSQAKSYVGGQVAMPATGSYVVNELTAEIKSAYAKMPEATQINLKDVIAIAKSKNPDCWLSQITF